MKETITMTSNLVHQNAVYWQEFSVPFSYPVAFTRRLFDPENSLLADLIDKRKENKRHKCFFIYDKGLSNIYPQLVKDITHYVDAYSATIELIAEPMSVPGGEVIKNELTHMEALQDAIQLHNIDRHSYVIAMGGGAVLDAVGLASTIAHRGVRHIRIPTTVLSQNDSGVGVKNAINLNGLKNYTGTFAPPWAVLNDFDFLAHLPNRERTAGISEAVKVALIRDHSFFIWLEKYADDLATFQPEAEEYMIKRSAELHMNQIANGGDPFENGSARPLDFGHWSAHKLEAITKNHVRHGEAVAIGIALDTRYSVLTGFLEEGEDERIAILLENLGLRIWHSALDRTNEDGNLQILDGLKEFQEHLGGELTITLLEDIGKGYEVNSIDSNIVRQSLKWLKEREGAE